MKRFFLAALIVAAGSPAFAFENEPNGFRGVEWGAPLDAVRAKVALVFNQQVETDTVEYRSRADLTVNGVPLRYNLYRFYKGRFFEGIMYTDPFYEVSLQQSFTARFGPPQDKAARQTAWSGPKTMVILSCSNWEKACVASFQSTEIAAQQIKDRAAAAKSSKDF